ncbi:MAG TPA: twin-arginine translocation signal domain-containing protein [Pyrinomonadaceae bacterium]|nr:twin-arginine translocation signal domain-containing protein [Pyrinomonadaceae bacterium]
MSHKNQSNEKLIRPIDLLEKYRLSQQHIPTLVQRSVSRRNFLVTGAIGAAAMTMSPLERAMAAYRFPSLETYVEPPKGFLVALGIGRLLAHILGFGFQFETAYGILNYFFGGDNASRDNARSGVDAAAAVIKDKGKKILDLIELGKTIYESPGKAVKTTFATTSKTARNMGGQSGIFRAHAAPPDDKRFFAMAVSPSSMNSLSPIFDYNGTNSQYDARAIVGLPTLESFKKLLSMPALQRKYGVQQLAGLVYPSFQPETYRAYGIWEESYPIQDRFETNSKTTLEFCYFYGGEYKVNNAPKGTVHGTLTIKLGGFPNATTGKNTESHTITDTYCWIPPTAPTKCIGVVDDTNPCVKMLKS